MMRRSKEQSGPRRLEPPWFAAAMIALTISAMAGGAIALGSGMALGQMPTRDK
jgi:hypothetical protein